MMRSLNLSRVLLVATLLLSSCVSVQRKDILAVQPSRPQFSEPVTRIQGSPYLKIHEDDLQALMIYIVELETYVKKLEALH